jgi:hypothetical protein
MLSPETEPAQEENGVKSVLKRLSTFPKMLNGAAERIFYW